MSQPNNDEMLNQLWQLLAGEKGLHEVGSGLLGWYVAGYEDGRSSRNQEISALHARLADETAAADLFYSAAFKKSDYQLAQTVSFAELCRRRGEVEKAAQVEAEMAALKFEVGAA